MSQGKRSSHYKALLITARIVLAISATSFVAYIVAGAITQFSLEPTKMLDDYFWTVISLIVVTALIVASGLYLLFYKKLSKIDDLERSNEANKQALKEYQEANEQARIMMAKLSIDKAGE